MPGYYRRASAVMICYDVTDEASFANVSKWRNQVEEYGKNDVIIMLIGCKQDLLNDAKEVIETKAKSLILKKEWSKYHTVHQFCSAKTRYHLRKMFRTAAELVLQQRRIIKVDRKDIIEEKENEAIEEMSKKSSDTDTIDSGDVDAEKEAEEVPMECIRLDEAVKKEELQKGDPLKKGCCAGSNKYTPPSHQEFSLIVCVCF